MIMAIKYTRFSNFISEKSAFGALYLCGTVPGNIAVVNMSNSFRFS